MQLTWQFVLLVIVAAILAGFFFSLGAKLFAKLLG